MPTSSYAPELLAVFAKADRDGEVRITLPSYSDATRLRFRFHNLRRDMRKEGHEMLTIAEGIVFRIPDKQNILIAERSDQDFISALTSAGVDISEIEQSKPAEPALEPEPIAEDPGARALSDSEVSEVLKQFLEEEDT